MLGWKSDGNPKSKAYGVNMGPTWVLSATDGPHAGPKNLVIRESTDATNLNDFSIV